MHVFSEIGDIGGLQTLLKLANCCEGSSGGSSIKLNPKSLNLLPLPDLTKIASFSSLDSEGGHPWDSERVEFTFEFEVDLSPRGNDIELPRDNW